MYEEDCKSHWRGEKESGGFFFLSLSRGHVYPFNAFHYLDLFLQWLLPFRALDPFVSYTVRSIDDTKPIHDPRNRIFLLLFFSSFFLFPSSSSSFALSPFLRGLGKISGISRESRFERWITPRGPLTRDFSDTPPVNRPCRPFEAVQIQLPKQHSPRLAIGWRRNGNRHTLASANHQTLVHFEQNEYLFDFVAQFYL